MDIKTVIETLIYEVKNRPCLWDKKHELYKNRMYVDIVWDEVAEAINKNKDQIKLKWRNLRDQFSRELKKNPVGEDGNHIVERYQGKWIYYDLLTFLKDTVGPKTAEESKQDGNQTDDNQVDDSVISRDNICIVIKSDPELDDDEGDSFMDPLEAQEDTSDSTSVAPLATDDGAKDRSQRKSRSSYILRQMRIQKDNLDAARLSSREVDDDLHFALSLVPYLRRLDPLRKLIIRNEMQNLLIGELIGDSSSKTQKSKK